MHQNYGKKYRLPCSLLGPWILKQYHVLGMQGGVGGGCNSKHYWLMELLLDSTNYFNWFFD